MINRSIHLHTVLRLADGIPECQDCRDCVLFFVDRNHSESLPSEASRCAFPVFVKIFTCKPTTHTSSGDANG